VIIIIIIVVATQGKVTHCENGFYNHNDRCEICPAGHYCQKSQKRTCAAGEYPNAERQANMCLPCDVGEFSDGKPVT